jgi:hypothetical protein
MRRCYGVTAGAGISIVARSGDTPAEAVAPEGVRVVGTGAGTGVAAGAGIVGAVPPGRTGRAVGSGIAPAGAAGTGTGAAAVAACAAGLTTVLGARMPMASSFPA